MKTGIVGIAIWMITMELSLAGRSKPAEALVKMPIKEITVFKDGHAFVLHAGSMPVDPFGNVVLDDLPTPVLGTYWPYTNEESAALSAVVAGKKKVCVEKTALTLEELIEANLGAEVFITESSKYYKATLLEIPTRSGKELEAYGPASDDERLPERSRLVMLRTDVGHVKVVELDRIQDITLVDKCVSTVSRKEFRNRLTLDLKWEGQPRSEADVGMVYLQRGIRWIPGYRVDIDDTGKAKLRLEATLVNELGHLDDVTAHLVVGVPSFAFKDLADPISLRSDVARLQSNYRGNNQTTFALSNAIMTQQADYRMDNRALSGNVNASLNLGPELGGTTRSEDLYMFTIEHVSLRKGERMVLSIAEYDLTYEDVYVLDIPFAPPLQMMRNIGDHQRREIMKLKFAPKVKHNIRIRNGSMHPFTTAPAMILRNGKLLAQGMMTYTPIGGRVDLELTTAVDISVKKTDNELRRETIQWNGSSYQQIHLGGKIELRNYKKEPVTVEIKRHMLGNVDRVDQNGKQEMMNPFEDKSFLPTGTVGQWWYGYSWPWWWYSLNGIGRVTWTCTLQPDEDSEHTYEWHYLWR